MCNDYMFIKKVEISNRLSFRNGYGSFLNESFTNTIHGSRPHDTHLVCVGLTVCIRVCGASILLC